MILRSTSLKMAPIGFLALLISVSIIVMFLITMFFVTSESKYWLSTFATLPIITLSVGFWYSHKIDLFSPLNGILASFIIAVTLETYYAVFSQSEFVDNRLLLGQPIDFLESPLLLLNIAAIMISLGWCIRPFKFSGLRKSYLLRKAWSEKKFYFAISFLVIIGLVCVVVFVQRIGISNIVSAPSAKRFLGTYSVEGITRTSSEGYLTWGASLLQWAFIFILVKMRFLRRRWVDLLLLALIFPLSVLVPFVKSSRGEILYFLVFGLASFHYLYRKISLQALMFFGVLFLVILSFLGVLRETSRGQITQFSDLLSLSTIYEKSVAGNYLIGVSKTGHIMNALDEGELSYTFGSTFLLWIVAPVPRNLWEGKPVITVGGNLGHIFYNGLTLTGVPPGMIAEVYWAGGWFTTIVGFFIFGYFLRFLYFNFVSLFKVAGGYILVYLSIVLPVLYRVLNTEFSGGIIMIIQSLIVVFLFLVFVVKYNLKWK